MPKLGLIGRKLGHSFSQKYFTTKFAQEAIQGYSYCNYELESISQFPDLWKDRDLLGVNVTIPYKQAVIDHLDYLDPIAEEIGAVNTVKRVGAKLHGYNTDYVGFKEDLLRFLGEEKVKQALVLGTGGASKAVILALNHLKIGPIPVSRTAGMGTLRYSDVDARLLNQSRLIINTTPLGMYPEVTTFPDLSYHVLTDQHFLYDLVYNPTETSFLRQGADYQAKTRNGMGMLIGQAEAAWNIWTTTSKHLK